MDDETGGAATKAFLRAAEFMAQWDLDNDPEVIIGRVEHQTTMVLAWPIEAWLEWLRKGLREAWKEAPDLYRYGHDPLRALESLAEAFLRIQGLRRNSTRTDQELIDACKAVKPALKRFEDENARARRRIHKDAGESPPAEPDKEVTDDDSRQCSSSEPDPEP